MAEPRKCNYLEELDLAWTSDADDPSSALHNVALLIINLSGKSRVCRMPATTCMCFPGEELDHKFMTDYATGMVRSSKSAAIGHVMVREI